MNKKPIQAANNAFENRLAMEGKKFKISPHKTVHLFKTIIIGDPGVGKTSIMERFVTGKFHPVYPCTLKIDAKVKSIDVDEENTVDLKVWDTCGQEKYRTITRTYFRNNNGCVLVFDLTDRQSFLNATQNWFRDISDYGQKDQTIVLVGSKKDLSEQRAVFLREIDNWLTKFKLTYFEVSSKTGENIDYLFEYLAINLLSKSDLKYRLPDWPNNYVSPVANSIILDKTLHSAKYNNVKKAKNDCCN